jgi:GT2 family glycosyltransferase
MNDQDIILNSKIDTINPNVFPRVAIIILNWNSWSDTLECLESVYQMTYPFFDVIVVDNGSENDSIEKIKEFAEGKIQVRSTFFTYSQENKPIDYFEYTRKVVDSDGIEKANILKNPAGKNLIIIKNEKNYGFAEGNNIAIRLLLNTHLSKYILILNNDTVVDKMLINHLVFLAESDKKVGFVGPKTYYYNYNGRTDVINFSGGLLDMWRGNSYPIGFQEVDRGQYDKTRIVDYVEGSCFLANKEVFEKIGCLDKSFFTYWEETDLCIRASRSGYRLMYAPEAKIWHKVAASSKGKVKSYYFTRNRFFFMRRNATSAQFFCFLLYFFGFDLFYQSGKALIYHQDFQEFKLFIKGVFDGILTQR